MCDFPTQLRALVDEACRHPPGHRLRQRALNQIVRLTTPKLWRDYSPYYNDALQQTWLYFSNNICLGKTNTTHPYDPEKGTVVTWLNAYLQRRLQDGFTETIDWRKRYSSLSARDRDTGEEREIDLVAAAEIPPILDQVQTWAETDATGQLRSLHIEGHPDVTAQHLILRRLPPETPWKTLSAEWGLGISTLSSFYQRKCLPLLRNFGQSEGYL